VTKLKEDEKTKPQLKQKKVKKDYEEAKTWKR